MARARYLGTRLNAETLLAHAGDKSFARGKKYQESGQVDDLRRHGDRITATVHGTEDYEVSIRASADTLSYSCDCPVGEDRGFCKHCVALGLEWLEQAEGGETQDEDTLGAYLESLDKAELVQILRTQASKDSDLEQKLLIKAAGATKSGVDLKKAIDRAMKSRTFVDYYHMRSYARAAGEVIDQIENVLAEGEAAIAIELAERALGAAEHTCGQCDDSDGYMSGVLGKLQEIHLQACVESKPEPIALAKHLFDWELRSEWEVFYQAAETYRDVLGEEGLTEYRRLAESVWAGVASLGAGENSKDDSSRFRIKSMMEAVARATGNLETLAEIQKRDLSSPYSYLRLGELYVKMGRRDAAVDWAQRGIATFAARPDERLYIFLADQYEQSGDEYGSMEVAWSLFSADPGFRHYPGLMERAVRLDQRELWRPRAIGAIRDAIAKRKETRGTLYYRPDSSDLVNVYLWEGNADAAWNEAREGGCSNHLMLQLAEKREKLHPSDAAPIYKAHIEALVGAANNSAYEQAVGFVHRVRGLQSPDEFSRYLESLRTRHKAKRNLMKLLASFH